MMMKNLTCDYLPMRPQPNGLASTPTVPRLAGALIPRLVGAPVPRLAGAAVPRLAGGRAALMAQHVAGDSPRSSATSSTRSFTLAGELTLACLGPCCWQGEIRNVTSMLQ